MLAIFVYIKGHYSEVAEVIWLVIKLGPDIMPINISQKFYEDRTTLLPNAFIFCKEHAFIDI